MEEERNGTGGQPYESEKERIDRELIELLNELRVALPGVQVLFAFLLAVPFQQRFSTVSAFQRDVYYGTLLMTTISAALLIAPSAYHRLNFRKQDKRRIILHSNRLAIGGLATLAFAMTGVVLLITDFLFDTPLTIVATGCAMVMFGTFWAVLPLRRD
ncbi:MAG: DUF6328 family protein [Thermoleophilaceae bacterium]